MKRIAALPTILTLGTGFCGFMSLWYILKARTFTANASPFADFMETAGWMVLLAMVFDALDGKVARMVKAESDFGAQLDSLADVISFGVAPACMVVAMSTEIYQIGEVSSKALAQFGWAAASVFMLCAMMRLARFNVESNHDSEGTMYFAGLPAPAAGGFVAALVMMRYNIEGVVAAQQQAVKTMAATQEQISAMYGPVPAKLLPLMEPMATYLPFLAIALAILMVSRIRYVHVLNKLLADQERFSYVILILIGALFFYFTWLFSIPLAFLIYIIWGLVGGIRSSLRDKKALLEEDEGP